MWRDWKVSILYLRCDEEGGDEFGDLPDEEGFNSLFEMLGLPYVSSIFATTNLVSILYLRCTYLDTAHPPPVPAGFNSLFEMRSRRHCSRIQCTEFSFQFSI